MDEKYGEDDYMGFGDENTTSKKIVVKKNDEDDDIDSENESKKSADSDNDSDIAIDSGSDDDEEDGPKHIFIKQALTESANVRTSEYQVSDDENGDDDDDENDDEYLQKFDENLKEHIITDHHPEMQQHNYDEIDALCVIVKDDHGTIIDPLHRTLPFLTKYEKSRILGERAKQINAGAASFVRIENNVIDGYLIAMSELEQKMIPFIVKRPLPNGGCEYWRLKDLEII
jgi:DNA-directed RNA polymerase subunit K/omega